jgi:hypothetical protein
LAAPLFCRRFVFRKKWPPAKFADMAAKETAKEHGWQPKEATSDPQRHRIRQRLATGAWRDFHENKIAPALRGPQHRIRTHASPPPGIGREVESREKQSAVVHPWDAGSGRLSRGGTGPLAAPPCPRSPGCGRAAGTPLRERFRQRPHIDSTD